MLAIATTASVKLTAQTDPIYTISSAFPLSRQFCDSVIKRWNPNTSKFDIDDGGVEYIKSKKGDLIYVTQNSISDGLQHASNDTIWYKLNATGKCTQFFTNNKYEKRTYHYNTISGNAETRMDSVLGTNGQYQLVGKREYEFNSDGKLKRELIYWYNQSTSSLELTDSIICTYSGNEYIYKGTEGGGSIFSITYTIKVTLNTDGQIEQTDGFGLVIKFEYKDKLHQKTTVYGGWSDKIYESKYDLNGNKWGYISKVYNHNTGEVFYKDSVTLTCDLATSNKAVVNKTKTFSIYPNPCSTNAINVSASMDCNFTLISIQGKVLKIGTLTKGENQIELDGSLPAGLYLFNGNGFSERFILNR